MAQTRLDRLVLLLDTGTTPTVRSTAAAQLGDVIRTQPQQIWSLLSRVVPFLRSRSWDTRVAAGSAVEHMAREYTVWKPYSDAANQNQLVVKVEEGQDTIKPDANEDQLTFTSLDIENVLRHGEILAGSSGKEYDETVDMNEDVAERLKRQRKALKKQLGLEFGDDDIFQDSDLVADRSGSGKATNKTSSKERESVMKNLQKKELKRKRNVSDDTDNDDTKGMSARERFMMKRQQKLDKKSRSAMSTEAPEGAVVVEFKGRRASQPALNTNDAQLISLYGEDESSWPFEGFCNLLMIDLFDAVWEIRHGALLGLKAIMKTRGREAGMIKCDDKQLNSSRHLRWMEDAMVRVICLLALDRFADFVGGDSVVCPVRESAAQLLGIMTSILDDSLALKLASPLFRLMAENHPWEVRYAGLLGLKYWLAVRQDLLGIVMSQHRSGWLLLLKALKDQHDDIRSVASSALLPVAKTLVIEQADQVSPSQAASLMTPEEVVDHIVLTLWDALLDLDDLTAATASVMDLLSQLVLKPSISMLLVTRCRPESLLPRLHPFFRHSSQAVRISVLNIVEKLASLSASTSADGPRPIWLTEQLLGMVFQNFVLETRAEVQDVTMNVWCGIMDRLHGSWNPNLLTSRTLEQWISLLFNPFGERFNEQVLKHIGSADRPVATQDLTVVDRNQLLRGRMFGLKALGWLFGVLISTGGTGNGTLGSSLNQQILMYMDSPYANQRSYACILLDEWSRWCQTKTGLYPLMNDTANQQFGRQSIVANSLWLKVVEKLTLMDSKTSSVTYVETLHGLARLRAECQRVCNDFIRLDSRIQLQLPPPFRISMVSNVRQYLLTSVNSAVVAESPSTGYFDLAQAKYWIHTALPHYLNIIQQQSQAQISSALHEALRGHSELVRLLQIHEKSAETYSTQVASSFAGAVCQMGQLPPKLNPVIKPLMQSLKLESTYLLQQRSAQSLAVLLRLNAGLPSIENSASGTVVGGKTAANDKLIKNIITALCSDPRAIPAVPTSGQSDGIWTLLNQVSTSALEPSIGVTDVSFSIPNPTANGKKGKRGSATAPQTPKVQDASQSSQATQEQELAAFITRRGAEAALVSICETFKDELFSCLPKLWDSTTGVLLKVASSHEMQISEEDTRGLLENLFTLQILAPHLTTSIYDSLNQISLLKAVARTILSFNNIVRWMAAKCISVLFKHVPQHMVDILLLDILPLLGDSSNVIHRQGAAEAVHHIVRAMDVEVLPLLVFLIVPLLGRMSDPDESVRFLCSNVFAELVKLMPLESGVQEPPYLSEELTKRKKEERKFISQLMGGSTSMEEFEIPIKVNAQLRKYQKEGVSWLAFLNRYQLHGILCDDMGLGKTLQSICILASDHYSRRQRHIQNPSPETIPVPSLVVCPSTLVGHWNHELRHYVDCLKPLMYMGPPSDRRQHLPEIEKHDVIIMSYDVLRNDIEYFARFNFNYCILDEGHVIKNPKSKLTQAVKQVKAMKRLILSGTPIQNNVLELWSLFDFLMPGFLGKEKQFQERFAKPIQQSRDAKSSSVEQAKGALALEALHKQVLPFVLRRMKEQVLDDLPPKIIQDYYCELSQLQKDLYEQFAKSQMGVINDESEEIKAEESREITVRKEKPKHVFQALQYLRKLVNHPALVLNESHPQYLDVTGRLRRQQSSLRDIQHAPKLLALKELLNECGIGVKNESASDKDVDADILNADESVVVSQHRALIFCQLKSMLDMIEEDLLKMVMPSVTYMRMDGSTDALKRHEIVQTFNRDPSIDVLLLTTSVGGLGLNLTGADTVIFVEHDWNPSKDLQAMDRAHRLGQKKVVNVYRLITRGTLEEKIMGLQRFKLNMASTVINADNADMTSMETDQILDLFSLGTSTDEDISKAKKNKGKLTTKQVLEELEREGQQAGDTDYTNYGMDAFLKELQ